LHGPVRRNRHQSIALVGRYPQFPAAVEGQTIGAVEKRTLRPQGRLAGLPSAPISTFQMAPRAVSAMYRVFLASNTKPLATIGCSALPSGSLRVRFNPDCRFRSAAVGSDTIDDSAPPRKRRDCLPIEGDAVGSLGPSGKV
jgi:hypothetical protein